MSVCAVHVFSAICFVNWVQNWSKQWEQKSKQKRQEITNLHEFPETSNEVLILQNEDNVSPM